MLIDEAKKCILKTKLFEKVLWKNVLLAKLVGCMRFVGVSFGLYLFEHVMVCRERTASKDFSMMYTTDGICAFYAVF